MKYIESTSTNPYFNLALEEYVFENLPKDESYFMLWQNVNTIVIDTIITTKIASNFFFI